MEVSKVSDITNKEVAEYLRLDETDETEMNTLTAFISVAKQYIQSYTGLTEQQLDEYSEFAIVVLILCQDMWDNRTMYVDSKDLNNTVTTIVGMHSVNLL